MDELRLALRRLTKRPGATAASIATLACAIGAAAVTWSALSAVLLRPYPFADPEDLVFVGALQTTGRNAGTVEPGLVYPYLAHVRSSGVLENVAGAWGGVMPMVIDQGASEAHRAAVAFLSHDLFEVTGARITHGRAFRSDDDRRGAAPVALLSHSYWQRRFGGQPVVGRTILIRGGAVPIIGVWPAGFRGLDLAEPADIFLPLNTIAVAGAGMNYFADPSHEHSPTAGVQLIGRLAPGTGLAETNARLRTLPPPASARYPHVLSAAPLSGLAVPLRERTSMASFARLLALTVGLLLCAGCITVGMLLLIRTEARRGELAMCRALGASRARLAAGIALEGALLAAAGAVAAAPVAYWLFGAIGRFQLPGRIGIASLELSVDLRLVLVLAAAAIAGVVVISAIGGVFGFRANVADALRGPAGATPRVRRNLSRAALVSAQMAVAVFLVCGAGVFGRSVLAALSLNSDIEPHRVLAGAEILTPYGYDPQRGGVLFDEFGARLRRHPDVEGVAFHRFQSAMPERIVFDGIPTQVPGLVTFLGVDPDYHRVMQLRLLSGRTFSPADREGSPPVAIVSESLARVLTGSRDAVGRHVASAGRVNAQPVQIVGVISDLVDVVTQLDPLVVYLPLAQTPPSARGDFVVRVATGQVGTVRREIAGVFAALDPAILPRPVQTLEERIGRQMQSQQFAGTVLGALGAIAVLLTLLGAYVLADSMATMRMREMGIRAALGATRRQLGSIVLAETGRLIGIGILAGLGLAWLAAGTIRAFLFQVQPLDPITLGGASALILSLTLAVSLRAALRVARVDLAQVLRSE